MLHTYDVSDPDYALLDAGLIIPEIAAMTAGEGEAAGFFDDIGKAFSSVADVVTKPLEVITKPVMDVVKPIANVITNNPIFDIVKTGVSFIPGVGTAVSSGMSALAAIGRGQSLKDIALEAAKGALPGGAVTRAALDIGLGAIQGKNLGDLALQTLRKQVPGGELGKAAFDAGAAIAKGLINKPQQLAAKRNALPSQQAKATFDKAINAYKKKKTPKNVAFPTIGGPAQQVARQMQVLGKRALKAKQSDIARHLGVPTNDVRSASSAFLNRWAGYPVTNMMNVGESQTLEDAALCSGIEVGEYDFESEDTGAMSFLLVKNKPSVTLNLTPSFLQALYDKAPSNVKKSILAHGLLARVAQNTGELDATSGKWRLKSGDTGWAISKKLTGDGNRWKEIPGVNPGMKVTGSGTNQQLSPWKVGQLVSLPAGWLGTATPTTPVVPGASTLPSIIPAILPGLLETPSTPEPAATPGGKTYVVQSGDSLSKISKKYTGDGNRWKELYALPENRKTIGSNPDKIQVGQRLLLPDTWSTPAVTPTLPTLPIPGQLPSELPPVTPGPSVPSSSGEPTIAALQAMLAFFYSKHGQQVPIGLFSSSSVPAFGSDMDDLDGTWNDRSVEATKGFQGYWNADLVGAAMGMSGPTPLRTDGEMDQPTAAALQVQNKRDLEAMGAPGVPATTPTVVIPPTLPTLPTLPTTPSGGGTTPGWTEVLPTVVPAAEKPPAATSPQASSAGVQDNTGLLLLIGVGALAMTMASK
jgi:nucleoid-associated protein YgaU